MRLRIFLTVILSLGLGLLLLHLVPAPGSRPAGENPVRQKNLARILHLTDLALWTEACYTRHPSQADNFAPFQEHPSSPEHYPAGSLIGPPPAPQPSFPESRP
jgi:hypothetical protein